MPCRAELIWSRSPSLICQKRDELGLGEQAVDELDPFLRVRVGEEVADLLGGGCSPVRSSETRRRNAASLAGGLGGTLSDSSRLNSSSSMKFRRLSLAKSNSRSGLMTVASRVLDDLRLVANDQVGLGPAQERRPGPAGSTEAAESSLTRYEASRVTSRSWPSA